MASQIPASDPRNADTFREKTLLPLITRDAVKPLFHQVSFSFKDDTHVMRSATIQVSEPVSVKYNGEYLYVPVKPKETFSLAKACGAFPLTRAISDRAH